jgi:hypothetical protein
MEEQAAYFVKSVEKAFDVLLAFTPEHQRLTVSQVATLTDMTRASARRFLMTLADLGYLRADGPAFELTARSLDIGTSRTWRPGSTKPLPCASWTAPTSFTWRASRPPGCCPSPSRSAPGFRPGQRPWAGCSLAGCRNRNCSSTWRRSSCTVTPSAQSAASSSFAPRWMRRGTGAGPWCRRSWRKACAASRYLSGGETTSLPPRTCPCRRTGHRPRTWKGRLCRSSRKQPDG